MSRVSRLAAVVVAACLPAGGAARAAGEGFATGDLLLGATRVLVLGDSITHDGRWLATVVAWMERRGTSAEVIDCGLPSETVSGLSEAGHAGGRFPRPDLAERLDRVLRLVRPDVVLACYGMNCGIYQPLDEARFAAFKAGIERLRAAAERAGATLIHLTPPVYAGPPGTRGPAGDVDYDAVLAAYSRWLVGRRSDGWLVIDVHGPMRSELDARRVADPAFTFAPDAVHPDRAGHDAIARAVIAGCGDHAAAAALERLAPFLPEVQDRLVVLRDAYLAAAGHDRPGLPAGLSVAEAEARSRSLTDSIRARRLQLGGHGTESGEWSIWVRPFAPVVGQPRARD